MPSRQNAKTNSWRGWWLAIRPKTLPAAATGVVTGSAGDWPGMRRGQAPRAKGSRQVQPHGRKGLRGGGEWPPPTAYVGQRDIDQKTKSLQEPGRMLANVQRTQAIPVWNELKG